MAARWGFTDFIQRNREEAPLSLSLGGRTRYARRPERYAADDDDQWEEGYGSSGTDESEFESEEPCDEVLEAVLVRVPKTHSVRDILSWSLERFAQFPSARSRCCCGEGFENIRGYPKSGHWWESAVWESPDFPGDRIVNFEPASYEAFVFGNARPDLVPRAYYRKAYARRRAPCPLLKTDAWNDLLAGSGDVLAEYDSVSNRCHTDCTSMQFALQTKKENKCPIPDNDPIWEELGIT
jgi:hypothetical protein